MNEQEALNPAFDILVKDAPEGWTKLKLIFKWEEGIHTFKTFYQAESKASWNALNCADFNLMDLLDKFKVDSHKSEENPWSSYELIFDRNRKIKIDYKFGDPGIFDIT